MTQKSATQDLSTNKLPKAFDTGCQGQNATSHTEHSNFPITGVATFRCLSPDGIWEPQGPDLSNCSSPWINHITQKVKPFPCVDHSESAQWACSAPCFSHMRNPKGSTVMHKAWTMHSSQEFQGENKCLMEIKAERVREGKGEGLKSQIKLEWMTFLVRGKKREEEVGGHMESTELLKKETPFHASSRIFSCHASTG